MVYGLLMRQCRVKLATNRWRFWSRPPSIRPDARTTVSSVPGCGIAGESLVFLVEAEWRGRPGDSGLREREAMAQWQASRTSKSVAQVSVLYIDMWFKLSWFTSKHSDSSRLHSKSSELNLVLEGAVLSHWLPFVSSSRQCPNIWNMPLVSTTPNEIWTSWAQVKQQLTSNSQLQLSGNLYFLGQMSVRALRYSTFLFALLDCLPLSSCM